MGELIICSWLSLDLSLDASQRWLQEDLRRLEVHSSQDAKQQALRHLPHECKPCLTAMSHAHDIKHHLAIHSCSPEAGAAALEEEASR